MIRPNVAGAILTLPIALSAQIVWALLCAPIGLFYSVFDRERWSDPIDWPRFWEYALTPMALWLEDIEGEQ